MCCMNVLNPVFLMSNPKKWKNKRKNKEQSKPWFDDSCALLKKRLLNQVRLLKKNPRDPYIRGVYITCRKEYRKLIKENKNKVEIENLKEMQSLTSQPKKFWKKLKLILGKSKKKVDNHITPEEWIKHFSSLNSKDPEIMEENIQRCKLMNDKISYLEQTNEYVEPCPILDKDFSLNEVLAGIKSLKKGKASALDAISNDMLHCIGKSSAVLVLVEIFNKLLKFQLFPSQWATGIIVPLHKSGEVEDPNNYRGITLNSYISKLFTLLLNNRLTTWCEEKQLIHYNQIGFRKGFRTSDHAFTLKTMIDEAFRNKQKLFACFVDFRKAYDTVWRNGLLYKLLKNNVSVKFVNLIRNMYKELQLCIALPNGLSLPFSSKVGLKQGCNLSPLLFNIFINDIPNLIDNSDGDPPLLGNLPVSCLLYADDLVLLSRTQEGLQKSIEGLNKFSKKWYLEVNQKKTKCMVFSKGRPKQFPEFCFGNKTLEFCDEYCYLGVLFSRTGSLKSAAKFLTEKATNAMFALIRNLYGHRSVKPSIMIFYLTKWLYLLHYMV